MKDDACEEHRFGAGPEAVTAGKLKEHHHDDPS
jgi:hypothetical protein